MSISAQSQSYRESEVGALRDALRQAKIELFTQEQEAAKLRLSAARSEQALAELHHRLRNNFQLLGCSLRLQEQSVRDPDAASAIASARCRIIAVAQVHNSLTTDGQSDFVWSRQYFDDLCRAIGDSLGLKCSTSVEDFGIGIGMATSLGMILNELVINAAKHAFPSAESEPDIRVGFCRNANFAEMTVADRGPGLPDGFDLAAVKSLGLKIVYATAVQLGGSVQIARDKGAVFTVRAPLASGAVAFGGSGHA